MQGVNEEKEIEWGVGSGRGGGIFQDYHTIMSKSQRRKKKMCGVCVCVWGGRKEERDKSYR